MFLETLGMVKAWVTVFFSVFWVIFFGTKMVFSINCYMVFPLEHKIEHAGSMLSYAIIDSGSTCQMLAIFLGSC